MLCFFLMYCHVFFYGARMMRVREDVRLWRRRMMGCHCLSFFLRGWVTRRGTGWSDVFDKEKNTFNQSFSYTIFNSRWVYIGCQYATNKTNLENTRQSEWLTNADQGLTFPGAQHQYFWLSLTPCKPQEMLILYLATDQLIAWSFTTLQNAYNFIITS